VELRNNRGPEKDPVCGVLNVACANSTATVTQGVETHIAATYDGTAIRIYLNGILDSTTSAGNHPVRDIQPTPTDDARFKLGIGNQSIRTVHSRG